MLAIEISFPGGRYHATPWDKQVNEGAVEWPPSPWRILRALIATWYLKGDGVSENDLCSIIEKIATPPWFSLPPVTIASSCHYMPLYLSAIDGKTTQIYDTYAHIGDGKVLVAWPDVMLEEHEVMAMETLLSRIGYLGRAESWVDTRLADTKGFMLNCRPIVADDTTHDRVVSTMCCMGPDAYRSWRDQIVNVLMRGEGVNGPASTSKKSGTKRGKKNTSDELIPLTLFDALKVGTYDIQQAGWDHAPGSILVDYMLPRDAFKIKHVARENGDSTPRVARFAVRAKVPRTIFNALDLAEDVHDRLVHQSKGSKTFSGSENGIPIKEEHAYILCHGDEKTVNGIRINRITVFNRDGFNEREQDALRSLQYIKRGSKDTEAILIDMGDIEIFQSGADILSRSTMWTSLTPFVPTRCPKFTRAGAPKVDPSGLQIDSAEYDLRRLLAAKGYPKVAHITELPRADIGGSSRSWLAFKRRRSYPGKRPLNEAGFGFKIEFEKPVDGPVVAGYGCNFGLGLFRPVIRGD